MSQTPRTYTYWAHFPEDRQLIDTETITWHAPKGEVSITLLRHADLGASGDYYKSRIHQLYLSLAGQSQTLPYQRAEHHPEHGYVLIFGFGTRTLIRVPDEQRDAVMRIVAEYDAAHADARRRREADDEAEAQRLAGLQRVRGGAYDPTAR